MSVIRRIWRWPFALLAALGALCSAVWTVSTDYGERSFTFDASGWWRTGLAVAALAALMAFTPAMDTLARAGARRLARAAGIVTAAMAVVWVFAADASPVWDPLDLWTAATDPNAAQWAPDGYMERYPFQASMIVALKACRALAGSHAPLLFQLGNAALAGLASWAAVSWAAAVSDDPHAPAVAAALQAAFLPPVFQSTFVYGNQAGVTFTLLACLAQSRAMRSGNPRPHAAAAVILMTLALVAKRSMLPAAIAMILVWLWRAVGRHDPRPLIPAILAAVLAVTAPAALDAAILRHHGADPERGLPKSTWVVMGLGADDRGAGGVYRSLGMFDGYTFRLPAGEYSPAAQSAMDRRLIAARLKAMAGDPAGTLRSAGRKLLWEWAEPTHGSIGASNWTRGTDPPQSARPRTRIARAIYDGRTGAMTRAAMDAMQTMIYLGAALAYAVARIRARDTAPMLAAAGAFALYLVWESKSQYTLPWVQLLVPVAAIGWAAAAARMRAWAADRTRALEAGGHRLLDSAGVP